MDTPLRGQGRGFARARQSRGGRGNRGYRGNRASRGIRGRGRGSEDAELNKNTTENRMEWFIDKRKPHQSRRGLGSRYRGRGNTIRGGRSSATATTRSEVELATDAFSKLDIASVNSTPLLQSFVNKFLWLREPKVISYCEQNRIMYIMRGLPGSGKSSLVELILSVYDARMVSVCCADDYRYDSAGNYVWRKETLGSTHKACQQKAFKNCKVGINVVIIDNTNIKRDNFEYYLNLANQFHYHVVIAEMEEKNSTVLLRNRHKVPLQKIKSMATAYETVLPRYYGWAIGVSDTAFLKSHIRNVLSELLKSNSCFSEFLKRSNVVSVNNLFYRYNMKTSSTGNLTTHVTACYLGKATLNQALAYSHKTQVRASVGSVQNLHLIGLCITPRSLFGRVSLNQLQKDLFQFEETSSANESLFLKNELMRSSDILKSICHEIGIAVKDLNIEHGFAKFNSMFPFDLVKPEFTLGSTAHVTVGVVPPCKPVESKHDTFRVLLNELTLKYHYQETFSNFMVRNYGTDLWVVYFKKPIPIPSLFCGFYL